MFLLYKSIRKPTKTQFSEVSIRFKYLIYDAKSMWQKSKVKMLKTWLLNMFIMVMLVVLLLSTNKITDTGVLLVYISTWVLILHIWLGAYYMVKYLEQENTLVNNVLDLVPLICMSIGVLFFNRLEIWGAAFAVLFAFAIIKYKIINLSAKNKLIKEYTSKKIRNEIVSVPLLIFLAILAYVFNGNTIIIKFLQIMTLFSQFFFVIWLAYVKKVYYIFRKG